MAVCLHCRAAARAEARARLHRLGARAGMAALVVVLLTAAGSAGASMIDGGPAARLREAAVALRSIAASSGATLAAGHPAPSARRAAASPTGKSILTPVVPEGRTELRDGMYAVRAGDTVRVYFDGIMTRTRRRDKFELTVRNTLPAVYGVRADSLLASVRSGELTRGGDLITELPARGIRLALADGSALALWPETRPGRDGPLVVSYRATPAR
jgi:hypothetical protein